MARLLEAASASKVVARCVEVLALDFLDDFADNPVEFGMELADLVVISLWQQPAPFLSEPATKLAHLGITDRREVQRSLAAEKIPESRLPCPVHVYGLLNIFL